MSKPRVQGVYETVLYASNLDETGAFYRDALGLAPHGEASELAWKFRLPSGAMLLLFDPERSSPPGRDVPSHGATGQGHIAFSVDDLEHWRAALKDKGAAIEAEHAWAPGGRSLYLRDPAGNSVELVEGEVWA